MTSFREKFPLEKRRKESERILAKYPDRIPVIVERAKNNIEVPKIDRNKYLVPRDLTLSQFIYVIRKRIKLTSEQAIYIFINNRMPPSAELVSTIYKQDKDEDNFLYVQYSGEQTFG